MRHRIFCLIGKSGTGKDTLYRELLDDGALPFERLVPCTTRPIRAGEQDGRDYHFITKTEFVSRRDSGFFAEWAEVHGNFYGTPLGAVQDMLAKGQDVIFDIDVQGASQLHLTLPDARFAFILPPSLEELERRLRKRGTESEESLRTRLSHARAEIAQAHWYDALVINDDLDEAYAELRAFYPASSLSPRLCPGTLQRLCRA